MIYRLKWLTQAKSIKRLTFGHALAILSVQGCMFYINSLQSSWFLNAFALLEITKDPKEL